MDGVRRSMVLVVVVGVLAVLTACNPMRLDLIDGTHMVQWPERGLLRYEGPPEGLVVVDIPPGLDGYRVRVRAVIEESTGPDDRWCGAEAPGAPLEPCSATPPIVTSPDVLVAPDGAVGGRRAVITVWPGELVALLFLCDDAQGNATFCPSDWNPVVAVVDWDDRLVGDLSYAERWNDPEPSGGAGG